MYNLALIDADEVAYKVALMYQQKMYVTTRDGNILNKYKYKIDAVEAIENETDIDIIEEEEVYDYSNFKAETYSRISSITNAANCSKYKLLLSGENNFRYNKAKLLPYKGNREGSNPPIILEIVKNHLRDLGAESMDEFEADDLLSSYSCSTTGSVICSTDKDLKTVPSYNYDISHDKFSVITKEIADYNFFYQLLVGDPTDNIPSPYLLGDKGAVKLLESLGTMTNKEWYYSKLIPFYSSFLLARNVKTKEYKTKWYSGQDVEEVLEEVGSLLLMRRNFEVGENWKDYYVT